jgi:uncharacterized protein YndB with AHSA1/START domain
VKRDVRVHRLLAHPAERVWSALTDPSILGAWLMPNDLEPRLGHHFTFRMKPQRGWDGVTHCEVIELEPLRRITFSYRGRATGEKALSCAGVTSSEALGAGKGIFAELDTVLRFAIESEPACDGAERTRLVLEHKGFSGLKLVVVSLVIGHGWKTRVLPRLEALLERERAGV